MGLFQCRKVWPRHVSLFQQGSIRASLKRDDIARPIVLEGKKQAQIVCRRRYKQLLVLQTIMVKEKPVASWRARWSRREPSCPGCRRRRPSGHAVRRSIHAPAKIPGADG